MNPLLSAATMAALVVFTSATAIGNPLGDLVCQMSTDTAEHLTIILNYDEREHTLEGSVRLSNCIPVLFCVGGSNVTLPRELELTPSPGGITTATVAIPLLELTEAIRQISLGRLCCVNGLTQPDSAKCFEPELQYAPVLNRSVDFEEIDNKSPVGGDNVTLTCPLISNPPGNYSWSLGSYWGPTTFDRSTERVLTLAPLKREHVGCYFCRVVNEHGTDTVDLCDSPYWVEVESHCGSAEKAAVQVSAPQIEVEEGSTVVVNCSWSYLKDERNIEWVGPNETNIYGTPIHQDTFTCMGWMELKIDNFTAGMEGDYSCVVGSAGVETVRLILAKPPNSTGIPLMYGVPSTSATGVIVGVSVSLVVLLIAMVTLLLVVLLVCVRPRPVRKVSGKPLELPPRVGFRYDVFLSFHDERDGFVRDHILEPLKAAGYKVCYHHDDFEPGVGIYDNIHGNMDNSRVAVLVLSKSYTSSEYCCEEMRYAIQAVDKSHTRRLLPVAWRKEDVPKELGELTYLEVKEGKEGELAKGIRDRIGEPIDCNEDEPIAVAV